MNIKSDIQAAMDRLGWSANRLAQESGVPTPVLTRVLRGTRKGIHSSTLEKLWPYLYPDATPPAPDSLPSDPPAAA